MSISNENIRTKLLSRNVKLYKIHATDVLVFSICLCLEIETNAKQNKIYGAHDRARAMLCQFWHNKQWTEWVEVRRIPFIFPSFQSVIWLSIDMYLSVVVNFSSFHIGNARWNIYYDLRQFKREQIRRFVLKLNIMLLILRVRQFKFGAINKTQNGTNQSNGNYCQFKK